VSSGREIAAAVGPLGHALAQVAHLHRLELVSRLGELGLHPGQELIVVDLDANPGSTQAELVGRLGVEQATVAKALGRMERAGVIGRSRDDVDARVVRATLTPRGRALVGPVTELWAELDRTFAAGLTADETTHLADLLAKVRRTMTRSAREHGSGA
jgi:DNA-binding MarR family transcriptional regulator